METKALKSGTMKFTQTHTCTEKVRLIEDVLIPNDTNYIYLETEINKELEFKSRSKHYIAAGKNSLAFMYSTLINTEVNLRYRRLLIKNVIIPKIKFGGEIHGIRK